jgi:hypothetical protein
MHVADIVQALKDPKLFNYLIMVLYLLNAGRWAWQRNWADMSYWLSAFAITATVTWGYKH